MGCIENWTNYCDKEDVIQAVVPLSARRQILGILHGSKAGYRLGVSQTVQKVGQRYCTAAA